MQLIARILAALLLTVALCGQILVNSGTSSGGGGGGLSANQLGYTGCSNVMGYVGQNTSPGSNFYQDGYYGTAGAAIMWQLFNPTFSGLYNMGNGTLQAWAVDGVPSGGVGNGSDYWALFDAQVQAFGQPKAVYMPLCLSSNFPEPTYASIKAMFDNAFNHTIGCPTNPNCFNNGVTVTVIGGLMKATTGAHSNSIPWTVNTKFYIAPLTNVCDTDADVVSGACTLNPNSLCALFNYSGKPNQAFLDVDSFANTAVTDTTLLFSGLAFAGAGHSTIRATFPFGPLVQADGQVGSDGCHPNIPLGTTKAGNNLHAWVDQLVVPN